MQWANVRHSTSLRQRGRTLSASRSETCIVRMASHRSPRYGPWQIKKQHSAPETVVRKILSQMGVGSPAPPKGQPRAETK